MNKLWSGLGRLEWTVNRRDINGLVLVAGVLVATIAMAGASEVEFQRRADELSTLTSIARPDPVKLAHCPISPGASATMVR